MQLDVTGKDASESELVLYLGTLHSPFHFLPQGSIIREALIPLRLGRQLASDGRLAAGDAVSPDGAGKGLEKGRAVC